uniref:NADH dehydrogenase subunit 6 n=1 Tax=Platystethus arenarius TaxID=347436 RepID=UPI002A83C160|nr:NADH dehydrogenase subunit 6 [Platystethus arenarius]WON66118.1 NADH dehydrogenase subunit 6 [Platystethus arenarius]
MLMVNFSIMFISCSHPISMGITLLIQTIFMALSMNMLLLTPWFSYILLLVMIGGLLILFIYMTSLMANEKFKFSPLMLMMNLATIITMIPLNFMDKFNHMNMKNYLMFNYSLNLNFNKFIMMPSIMSMMILIIYLLMVLIAVVKISNFKSGPLRQKF